MTSAAIYARVSSARQKKDETIGSQTSALREHAAQARLDVPEEWVFEDEGHSGATLVRPALEALRDLAAQGCLDVVLCYSPDRLARKFAYQALLLEEFARAGVRVEFVKGPRGDTPEDQLLVQFQGIFAEYEKAQLAERYRRGKAHRARTGSVNVLSGAPFGYRYVRKTDLCGAAYEVIEGEAVLVAEMFRRYADDGAAIADLARWLTDQGAPTRTGKHRWDRSVIWAMLRNPAYAGTAVFGKTMVVQESPGLNRVARLQGRSVPRAVKTVDRPRDQWLEIAVPAIVTAESFARVQQRLEGNKRFAARNTKVPSLLQGLAACSACGYGYYRTSARTTSRKIYYYRCLGSDDYRYEGGRVCANKPVRADYLDTVVWDHITGLLADPALIRAEISKRLDAARTADPATRQRKQLQAALAKATASVTAMIEAFSEQLITIDELRAKMPHLRARETSLRGQIDALDAQTADRDAYLTLADDLEGFLAQLRGNAATATVEDRQRVLRLLVKDILIGPETTQPVLGGHRRTQVDNDQPFRCSLEHVHYAAFLAGTRIRHGRLPVPAFSTVVWRPRHPYTCSSLRSSASCEATSRSASSSCRRTPAGRSSSRVVPVSVCSSASCAAICSSASSSCRRTSAGRSSSGVMACPLLTLATHAGGPDQVHSVNARLFSVYAALVPSLVTLALACARSWRQGLRQPGAAVSGRWLLPLPLCSTHGCGPQVAWHLAAPSMLQGSVTRSGLAAGVLRAGIILE